MRCQPWTTSSAAHPRTSLDCMATIARPTTGRTPRSQERTSFPCTVRLACAYTNTIARAAYFWSRITNTLRAIAGVFGGWTASDFTATVADAAAFAYAVRGRPREDLFFTACFMLQCARLSPFVRVNGHRCTARTATCSLRQCSRYDLCWCWRRSDSALFKTSFLLPPPPGFAWQ